MRLIVTVGAAFTAISPLAMPQLQLPLFTADERASIVHLWAAPGCYTVRAAMPRGRPLAVRLTPEASIWFHAVATAAGHHISPPTVDDPTGADTWERWIAQKLTRDRALAGVTVDPRAVTALPTAPGPIPDDLLAAVGNPPPLAEAVAPLSYTVHLDTGNSYSYEDHANLRPQYAYYRFAEGVDDSGSAVAELPESELKRLFDRANATLFLRHVTTAVSRLEGGFDAVNTYDTGYVSVGFVQFASLAEGGGSLGELLVWEKTHEAHSFDKDFHHYGIDVTAAGLVDVLDPATGAELVGPDANISIIHDKRLIAVFQQAGATSDAFRLAQVQSALAQFYPADDPVTVDVNGTPQTVRVGDIFKSEAGVATLFDRKVNTGHLNGFPAEVEHIVKTHKLSDLRSAADYEAEMTKDLTYRKNYLKDRTLTQPGPSPATDEAAQ